MKKSTKKPLKKSKSPSTKISIKPADEVKIELVTPIINPDLSQLDPGELAELETLKTNIATEIRQGTNFQSDVWKFQLENILTAAPEDLSPFGRQTLMIFENLIPIEIINQFRSSPSTPAPQSSAPTPQKSVEIQH